MTATGDAGEPSAGRGKKKTGRGGRGRKVPADRDPVESRRVPVDTGTASVTAGVDQLALTSIVLGIAACGLGTLTSSMPCAYFASTWAASTP
jgi:hypothetical protein